MDELLGKLSKEQYWEWKYRISEMQLADCKLAREELKVDRMAKEVEIQKLHTLLAKATLDGHRNSSAVAKKDYEECRSRISQELGFELKDCVVDEITLEVKKVS